jgi:hypothetical protein
MKENDQDLMHSKELEQILIPHLSKCDGAVYVTGDGINF